MNEQKAADYVRLLNLADSLLSLAVYRHEADTRLWRDDVVTLIGEIRATLKAEQNTHPREIVQVKVEYLDCPHCPRVDMTLIGACASVGIEHGRSTSQELDLYLEAAHSAHSASGGEGE